MENLKSYDEKLIQSSDISVVIPLFNKEDTISRAIESVLNQSILPFELIIVNDGSMDNSAGIVKKIQEKSSRVKLIQQENKGVSTARNVGVKHVKTSFVSFLDADDEWMPDYIENLLKLINHTPHADLYSLRFQYYIDGRYLVPNVNLSDSFIGKVPDFLSVYNRGYGLICSSTANFKTRFFRDIGGFPENENSGEDIYLWIKSALVGECAFMNQVVATIYKKKENSTLRRANSIPYHIRYYCDHIPHFENSEQKILKSFLFKNIFLQWAAAKIEKNRWQRNILRTYCSKLSKLYASVLYLAELLPGSLFIYLREKRNKLRINSD